MPPEEEELTPDELEENEDSEVQDEPEDNSNLGRRLDAMERSLHDFTSNVQASISTLSEQQRRDPELLDEPEDEGDDYVPMTTKEFRNFLRKELDTRDMQRVRQQDDYQRKYISSLAKQGLDLSEEENSAIITELESNRTVSAKRTGNPEIDAELHYLAAERALLRKKGRAIPIRGGENNSPLGGSVNSDPVPRSKAPIKLSKEAEEFARMTGMTEDQIREALGSEMPLSMRGGGR